MLYTSERFHTLIINYHTVLGYTIRSGTYCSSKFDEYYSTKMEAEKRCDQMQQQHNNCTTINDKDCDDDNYKICKEGSSINQSSTGSCTYDKNFRQSNINSQYFSTSFKLKFDNCNIL